ncbi:MAG: CDP-alcohol phosphatidyltransferase family protein [Flavobacterium sp.]|jgi:CDP-diacylglycerol--serine O-phosphatidyltransferase|uniref:CDP-alcohol phosphatidyltransferase family protein n=1 Tax=Flavobacterium sp. TaxID=239 RepID=UPI002B49BC3B|nr:CDP-alcohol phosphatidyltransferase family protein [Flavobacterium sp.]WRH72918.1 MAG: CDP-alcohol phosphatidyltransferase family protein [Flavobacterium sp.]
MQIKKHIPNLITLLNLTCGLLAVIAIFRDQEAEAFWFVCLGIFFDFWDGFFARKYNVSGDLGLQLDSLADMVTCGVVPGLMIFKLIENLQIDSTSPYFLTEDTWYMGFVPYLGFLITLASCYRLAKFNIDTRQTDSFIGLPTPANAMFIMSLPMIRFSYEDQWAGMLVKNPFILLAITIISAYILNAEIPLFSLKIKEFTWAKYKMQILFLIGSLFSFSLLGFVAIPLIIISYVLVSVISNKMMAKE